MKIISKSEYDIITLNKKLSDGLEKTQENYYQELVKILGCKENNGWLVDYFFNDNVDIEMLLHKLNISVENSDKP